MITPVAELEWNTLQAYLQCQGMEPSVINWKYGPSRWSGGNRGWAWVQGEQVMGFVGEMPFAFMGEMGPRQARWLVDWSMDPSLRGSGLGGRLLRHAAQSAATPCYALGGNALSALMLAGMSSLSGPACHEYRMNLRLGARLQNWSRRWPRLKDLSGSALGNLPLSALKPALRGQALPARQPDVETLARFEQTARRPGQLLWQAEQLAWLLKDCPGIQALGWCHQASDSAAALLAWAPQHDGRLWRLVIHSGRCPDAPAMMELMLGALPTLLERGAHQVALMLDLQDETLAALLRDLGFHAAGHHRQLFRLGSNQTDSTMNLCGFNFLSSDIAHRFD